MGGNAFWIVQCFNDLLADDERAFAKLFILARYGVPR
jgi:hypothetical protein